MHVEAVEAFAWLSIESTTSLSDVIYQRLRKKTLFSIKIEFDVVLPLAELATISIHDEWKMTELRWGPS